MFLRATTRKKDGKEHRYYSVVENKRVGGGRVLQRHVLYLGEINSSQELAWRRSIEVFDEADDGARTLALFPEDRCEGIVPDESIVRLKLGQLRLERPRQWSGVPAGSRCSSVHILLGSRPRTLQPAIDTQRFRAPVRSRAKNTGSSNNALHHLNAAP